MGWRSTASGGNCSTGSSAPTWTGNPHVNETIDGVEFDLATSVLRREADAGRVGILGALAG